MSTTPPQSIIWEEHVAAPYAIRPEPKPLLKPNPNVTYATDPTTTTG